MELSQEVRVVKGLPADWGTCFRTVTLKDPLTLTCWKDAIAVGLGNGDIIILDGITGGQSARLSGHTKHVGSLAFTPDGISLASGSWDKTIKLWDMQTGGIAKSFCGHTDWVNSISISADGMIIASGSTDKTIRLWDIQTEECKRILTQGSVKCVHFSPMDPQYLVSVSGYKVQHWNISGSKTRPIRNGSCIAFSSDATRFALCWGGSISVVPNLDSETDETTFHTAKKHIPHYCCFSPDDRYLAVAAGSVAYIWDITSSNPQHFKAIFRHTRDITSLSFSSPSSLVSSSTGNLVKFWHIGAPTINPVATNIESIPLASAQINSISLHVKDGIAISSDSHGVVRTWDLLTGLCRASFQTPAEDPDCCDIQLVSGKLILVWHMNEMIYIEDVENGELLESINIPEYSAYSIRISGDGSKVFCLCWKTLQVWFIQTGEMMGLELEDSEVLRSLTVDGSRVWVHSPQSEPMGWDFGIPGSSPVQLLNIPMLQPKDTKLWYIGQSGIRDAVTGEVVFQLAGRFVNPVVSQWDGQYLAAGYKSGEVLILDFDQVLSW